MKKGYLRSVKNYILVLSIAVFIIAAGILAFGLLGKNEITKYSQKAVAMKELPSQMSFTYYEEEEWSRILKDINGRNLKGTLTYGKLEELLEKLSLQEYITYEKKQWFQNVSRKAWNGIYEQMLDLLDVDGTVKAVNLVFLTDKTEKQEEDGRLTQRGYYKVAKGADYFGCYDTYRVYVKDREVIGVNSRCTSKVKMKNVFVHQARKEKAEVLYENQQISLDIQGLKENITDTICDVVWQDNKVSAIYKKEDRIEGKVLRFGDGKIEISGYGTLKYDGKLKIYKTYGTVEQLDESKLVIGNLQADFVVAKKKVCGIILKQPAEIENIRVLLLEEGNQYHKNPFFTASTECTVTIGKKTRKVPAGQAVGEAALYGEGSQDYVKLSLEDAEGRIYFCDEGGGRTSVGYRGSIEIRRYPEGYGVVNELSLEQYLYGVVPSEMPPTYEKEALRVQAVCARSYACIQLMKGEYAAFGANVDDSTNYQVYNNREEDEAANLAVDDTVGEVIKYNGEIAEAYYFSTSCGHTAGLEVWNQPSEEQSGYLSGTALLTDGSEPDLSSEEVFAEFIKNKEVTAYDDQGAYFRWRAELNPAGNLEGCNQAILERRQISEESVQIKKEDGSPAVPEELAGLGNIQGMKVLARSSAGCILQLQISYEHGTVELKNEYNIRYVLGKAVSRLTDKNEKEVEMALLPSAYAVIIPVETGYAVYGGGYGHGIGMSQNGANGMAESGMAYPDILMKFYQDITIENIYNGE